MLQEEFVNNGKFRSHNWLKNKCFISRAFFKLNMTEQVVVTVSEIFLRLIFDSSPACGFPREVTSHN